MSRLSLIVMSILSLLLVQCGEAPEEEPAPPPAWPEIAGYELMTVPADNPMTEAKVELGKQLYYDQRLSGRRQSLLLWLPPPGARPDGRARHGAGSL